MKLIIIESPFAGDVERNVIYARRALLDSLKRGEAPFASHLLYPQVLDDDDAFERRAGIDAGLAWSAIVKDVAFYEDYGMSPGMVGALGFYESIPKHSRPTIWWRKIGANPIPEPHETEGEPPHRLAFLPRDPGKTQEDVGPRACQKLPRNPEGHARKKGSRS